MRLLCFQARHFAWRSFARTVGDEGDQGVADELRDCVVVFAHAERQDEQEDARDRVLRHAQKHVKWLANKRELRGVVLHSFTHLGGENASPEFARTFLEELAVRLQGGGYEVKCTPFGYFCEWQLDVFGESLAKVYKHI